MQQESKEIACVRDILRIEFVLQMYEERSVMGVWS